MSTEDEPSSTPKQESLLIAIAALLAATYEEPAGGPSVETLLAGSGLGYRDIAHILGKKPDAVRMKLKRNESR